MLDSFPPPHTVQKAKWANSKWTGKWIQFLCRDVGCALVWMHKTLLPCRVKRSFANYNWYNLLQGLLHNLINRKKKNLPWKVRFQGGFSLLCNLQNKSIKVIVTSLSGIVDILSGITRIYIYIHSMRWGSSIKWQCQKQNKNAMVFCFNNCIFNCVIQTTKNTLSVKMQN